MTENRTALVTGANKGIGYEIAAGLGALDWTVGVGARDDGRREAAVATLRADGVDAFGGQDQMPTTVDPATVLAAVETNVIGVIRVTSAMLPMLRQSSAPRIVNMSSTVGSLTRQTTPGGEVGPIAAAYSPSRTFLNAVMVQYAKELRDTNILINAGCPGYVATDLNGFRGFRKPEQGAAIAIRLATLPDDGPTGGFFDDDGVVPW